jgi:predicted dehydrogenase
MRFGLLGTGYWATEVHAAALASHPRAELVGVWGRTPERARALAERHGAKPYEDVDEFLAAVDAVAVALPPHVQAEHAERAALAGRHLLLDKPLALSAEAADRVVGAVERSGVRCVVFHTARFAGEIDAWLRDVRSSDDWHGASVTWTESLFEEPDGPYAESAWRREKGALWDIGPHALDMILATLGPVDDVVARRGRGDTVHVLLHHASGASSTLALSLTVPLDARINAWYVYGPRGVFTRPPMQTPAVEAYGNALTALLADDDDGGWTGHESDVRHARDIVRILEQAARSAGD